MLADLNLLPANDNCRLAPVHARHRHHTQQAAAADAELLAAHAFAPDPWAPLSGEAYTLVKPFADVREYVVRPPLCQTVPYPAAEAKRTVQRLVGDCAGRTSTDSRRVLIEHDGTHAQGLAAANARFTCFSMQASHTCVNVLGRLNVLTFVTPLARKHVWQRLATRFAHVWHAAARLWAGCRTPVQLRQLCTLSCRCGRRILSRITILA